jgi:D-sedoheptulose 7-phosphate isomerase
MSMQEVIINEITESINVKEATLQNKEIIEKIEQIVNACLGSLTSGGKIIFCGNGGSFADAQHLTAEFVSRLRFDRPSLASLALGTNSSCMSAIGNDYGYDQVFARELLALYSNKDVFIPISTSGNSPNILNAISVAKDKGITIFGFTGGTGGKMASLCDCIIVPSLKTEKIQEVHIMLGHIICSLVETKYFKSNQI